MMKTYYYYLNTRWEDLEDIEDYIVRNDKAFNTMVTTVAMAYYSHNEKFHRICDELELTKADKEEILDCFVYNDMTCELYDGLVKAYLDTLDIIEDEEEEW